MKYIDSESLNPGKLPTPIDSDYVALVTVPHCCYGTGQLSYILPVNTNIYCISCGFQMAQSRSTEYRKTRDALKRIIANISDDDHGATATGVQTELDMETEAMETRPQCLQYDSPPDELWYPALSDAHAEDERDDDEIFSDGEDEISSDGEDEIFSDGEDGSFSDGGEDAKGDTNACSALADWAVRYGISHAALLALLAILNLLGLAVPLDPRTLLRTPASSSRQLVKMGSGEYFYFGIARSVLNIFKNASPRPAEVRLKVNVDGLPLFKSTSTVLWPILGMVTNAGQHVFTIAVYCGKDKPPLTEFLKDFSKECRTLLETGIAYAGQTVPFKIACFICDAPARAFLKGIKGHSGYNACERCTQTGIYDTGRMTFPECDAPQRTHDSFIAMSDADHHRLQSPLIALVPNMVRDFTLDYMHMCCLGVTKLMIRLWMSGPLTVRLPASVAERISGRLSALGSSFPKEFARKPRSLYDYRMWKATEFRTFMLYTGPIVLKGLLSDDMYNLFLCFSSAMTVLLCPDFAYRYSAFAKGLMCTFVKNFAKLFGSQFVVYNVHSLIHLSEDAEIHGALDNVSCFPFENYLHSLKRMVRRPNDPLPQLINRLGELARTGHGRTHDSGTAISLGKRHMDGPVPQGIEGRFTQHRQCQVRYFVSSKDGDNCFLLWGSTVILVCNVIKTATGVFVAALKFAEMRPYYTYPFSSDKIGIMVATKLTKKPELVPIADWSRGRKCVRSSQADGSDVIIPILHE